MPMRKAKITGLGTPVRSGGTPETRSTRGAAGRPPLVDEKAIRDLADRIVRAFQPEKIILFGSYAYGAPSGDSDVDLLVVLRFRGRNFDKSMEILDAVTPAFPVDLLARTPQDVSRRYADYDPLIREALDRGKVLYDRDR